MESREVLGLLSRMRELLFWLSEDCEAPVPTDESIHELLLEVDKVLEALHA
jgi:hypothetical protein